MPNFGVYGPISHGFNRDPQIHELRKRFGDWMALVWIEMILISDQHGGVIKGTPEEIAASLAPISNWSRRHLAISRVSAALQLMVSWGFIDIQPTFTTVLKYAKYHKSENTLTNKQTNILDGVKVFGSRRRPPRKAEPDNNRLSPDEAHRLLIELADKMKVH